MCADKSNEQTLRTTATPLFTSSKRNISTLLRTKSSHLSKTLSVLAKFVVSKMHTRNLAPLVLFCFISCMGAMTASARKQITDPKELEPKLSLLQKMIFHSAPLEKFKESFVIYDGHNEINQRNINGHTLLFEAAVRNLGTHVEYLLMMGADPEIGDDDGYTPIHVAAYHGCPDSIRALVQVGNVDPNSFHWDTLAPIHRAAFGGSSKHELAILVLVEELGVDPSTKAKDGRTVEDMFQGNKPGLKAFLKHLIAKRKREQEQEADKQGSESRKSEL